jgi:hypothetical protein
LGIGVIIKRIMLKISKGRWVRLPLFSN